MIKKQYTIITTHDQAREAIEYIRSCEYLTYDTETTGLNVRKDKVIGFSFCGKAGVAYYLPIYKWNCGLETLEFYDESLLPFVDEILHELKQKELLMWNGSFDIRITKNDLGIDFLENLIAEGMLLKHTIQEDGSFALKEVAVMLQKKIGYDAEETANQEQIELKENIKKNGGEITKKNFEMYKADTSVLGKYACFAEKSSLVTMQDGSCKFIEDVNVGDRVITHKGRSKIVYSTNKRSHKGKIYNIETEAGRKIKNVTSEHPFYVYDENKDEYIWKTVKDLKVNDLLVKGSVNDKWSGKGQINRYSNFWWLFGLYQADGYVRIQKNNKYPVYTIHQDEVGFLQNILEDSKLTYSITQKKNSKAVSVVISNSDLGQLFLNLSGGKFYAWEKKISKDALNQLSNNKEDFLNFIAGIMDGDSHFRRLKNRSNSYQLELSITSPHLINTIDLLCTVHGLNCTRGDQSTTGTRRHRYYVRFFKNASSVINQYLNVKYDDNLKIIPETFKKLVRIKNIKVSDFDDYVYNISVQGDESYISNGLISHNCADADMTLRICEYYKNKLEEEDLFDFFFFDEVMPLYKEVTIPMEDRGVKLDLKLIQQSKEEIVKDIRQLEKQIVEELMKTDAAKKWYEDKVKSSYKAKPTGKFLQAYIDLYDLDFPKSEKTGKYSVTKKEKERFRGTVHGDFLLDGIIDEDEAYAIKCQLYLSENNSCPIQISSKKKMSEIVFDYMGIEPLSRTEKNNPQFNDAMVDHLSNEGVSWAKAFHNYNKLNKVKSSYIDRFLSAEEDGYYYFSYKQHGTISGRYGSDAQQLSRPLEEGQEDPIVIKYVNRIRSFIKARDGYKLIICDQSSLEPRVFASVSGDENLINVFLNDEDLYSRVAIQAFKLSGVSAKKSDPNFLKKVHPDLRQQSKGITLSIPYGAGEFQISRILDISLEEARKLINSYLSGFPDLANWMEESKQYCQKHGKIKVKSGRVRHLPAVKNLYREYGDKLLNWKFRVQLTKQLGGGKENEDLVKNMYRDYKNGVNNSRNVQIQGLAASIMNRSGINMSRSFRKNSLDAHTIMQIHDEYVVEVLEDDAHHAARIVKHDMENSFTIDVPLIAEPNIADHFGEGHD